VTGRRAALALAALLVAAGPARAASFAVDLEAPADAPFETPLPLIELRGRAGLPGARRHDVVIAIDLSDSTTAPSGMDLDGDGPGGRTSPALLRELEQAGADPALRKRLTELDLEDSTLFAELAAAEVLLERLDPRAFRVGLVVFSDAARVVAPLGSRPEVLRRALAGLRRELGRDLRGTNFEAAIRSALGELAPASEGAPRPGEAGPVAGGARKRSLLLLSDGVPTLPPHGRRPQQHALEAAQEAALAGVRIYAYAIGPEAEAGLDLYRAVAATTGGAFERIEQPADAIARLRRVDLASLASVEIVNETSGQAARAVRTFPDGSFDGFVPLEPGANRVRVTALADDGSRGTVQREVVYRPAPGEELSAARQAEQRALLDELRRRTREVELWAEVERGRTIHLRELELGPEPAAAPPVP
jgi:hypothetical protein